MGCVRFFFHSLKQILHLFGQLVDPCGELGDIVDDTLMFYRVLVGCNVDAVFAVFICFGSFNMFLTFDADRLPC